MKQIKKQAQQEEADFYCDFTGEKIIDYIPVEVKIMFGHGSNHDGAALNLDLSDDAAEELLEFIKNKLTTQTKQKIAEELDKVENNYIDAMDARSWDECEYLGNSKRIFNWLIS